MGCSPRDRKESDTTERLHSLTHSLTPCSPRDSQEFSSAPQFESISSLVLSLLYGPALTHAHDYWKNHSFDYMDLCQQSDVSAFNMPSRFVMASLVAQRLKRLPAMQETRVQSLGQEDLLEKEMATHSSILAWRIPWTEEPGGL